MNKYELTEFTLVLPNGTKLYRIKALRDIPKWNVKAGDIGGFLQQEYNLSQAQDDDSWVAENATVYGSSELSGGVLVSGSATVCGESEITGDFYIHGYARLESVLLEGTGSISGKAKLDEVQLICENVQISGNVNLFRVKSTSVVKNLNINGSVVVAGKDSLFLSGQDIVLTDDVYSYDGGLISGQNIIVSGHAQLLCGMELNGKNIRIKDFAVLFGEFSIGDNSVIQDTVTIKGHYPDKKLKNVHLEGDLTLSPEQIHQTLLSEQA